MRLVAGLLFCFLAVVAAETTDALMKILKHKKLSEIASESTEENANAESMQVGNERFLGVSSTTTHTRVVMVTSTIFFSCLSGSETLVCAGRRKRKLVPTVLDFNDENSSSGSGRSLDSSFVDPEALTSSASSSSSSSSDPRVADKDSKFQFLTVWSAVSTTTTVTMLYTDTNTTIRLSFGCQAGLMVKPDSCPGP